MIWFPHGGETSGWVWTILAFTWIAIAVAAFIKTDRRATRSLPHAARRSPAQTRSLKDAK